VTIVLELAANNKLGNIILLRKTEQLADMASSLGSKTTRNSRSLIGKSRNLLFTLLDDHEVQDTNIRTNNAATDRLTLTLTLFLIYKTFAVHHDELCSKTYRRQEEGAHGDCREHPASWGNPAYRFLQ
jgi:hypothetical protein